MIEYLIQVSLFTVIGIAAYLLLRDCSANVRLSFCYAMLVVIAVPPLAIDLVTAQTAPVLAELLEAPPSGVETWVMSEESVNFSFFLFFAALSVLGGIAFVLEMWRHHVTCKRLQDVSEERDGFGVVPGRVAMASWWGGGSIWLGRELLDLPYHEEILRHEKTHLSHKHPQQLLLLMFLRCIFWWHPCVWLFTALAERNLEYACDEAVADDIGRERYLLALANLLRLHGLNRSPRRFAINWRTNMSRVYRLEKNPRFRFRHVGTLLISILMAGSSFVWVNGQTIEVQGGDFEGWSIELKNTTLVDALNTAADMGGLTIYADPKLDEEMRGDVKVDKVRTWQPIVESIADVFELHWRERAGVIYVSTGDRADLWGWLPGAKVIRGHGLGVLNQRGPTGDEAGAQVIINFVLQERSDENLHRNEMAIMVHTGKPASLKAHDKYIVINSRIDPGGTLLAVALFQVADDGQLSLVGEGEEQALFVGEVNFSWRKEAVDYEMTLVVTEA